MTPCKLQTFGSQVTWQPRPFVLCILGGPIPLVRNYEIQSFSTRCTFPLPCTRSVSREGHRRAQNLHTCWQLMPRALHSMAPAGVCRSRHPREEELPFSGGLEAFSYLITTGSGWWQGPWNYLILSHLFSD